MYMCAFTMIIALGFEKELLLSPIDILSDDYSTSYPVTNLMDSFTVTEVLVQNYGEELSVLIVRANGIGYLGCERNVEAISAHSWKANNFYVSPPGFVRLHVRTTSSRNPVLTRFYVFGCDESTNSPIIRPTRDPINTLVIMIVIFLFVPILIGGTIQGRRR